MLCKMFIQDLISRADTYNRTLRNQALSPLLSLPAELRNNVYEFTFGVLHIHFTGRSYTLYDRMPSDIESPIPLTMKALMQSTTACRQMHAETAILPLKNNVLILGDIHIVTSLLCWIPSTHHFVEFGVTELRGLRRRLSIRIASVRYNDIGSPQCFQDAVRALFERHSASKPEVIFTSVMGVD
jgi:hypothetical protein